MPAPACQPHRSSPKLEEEEEVGEEGKEGLLVEGEEVAPLGSVSGFAADYHAYDEREHQHGHRIFCRLVGDFFMSAD